MGLDCVVNRIAARIKLGDSLEPAGTLEAQEIKPVARELFLDRQRRINPPPDRDIRTIFEIHGGERKCFVTRFFHSWDLGLEV